MNWNDELLEYRGVDVQWTNAMKVLFWCAGDAVVQLVEAMRHKP
jgi:hypothetical protein